MWVEFLLTDRHDSEDIEYAIEDHSRNDKEWLGFSEQPSEVELTHESERVRFWAIEAYRRLGKL